MAKYWWLIDSPPANREKINFFIVRMEAYKNILKVEQYYKNVDVKDTSSGIKATITKTLSIVFKLTVNIKYKKF